MVASVEVQGLTFRYSDAVPEALANLSLSIESGSRLVLVGANGAGKSTLLSILAGHHMAPPGVVTVLGQDAFRAPRVQRRVALVAGDWSNMVSSLFSTNVKDLFASALGNTAEEDRAEAERRGRRLLALLGVQEHWTVGSVSEGQRRRIQLVLKLMAPHDLCLLDEATTDLDIIARRNLLLFLLQDSRVNGTTVVYCTHIFDGLDGWATHLALLADRRVARFESCAEGAAEAGALLAGGDPGGLYALVKGWLQAGRAAAEQPPLPPAGAPVPEGGAGSAPGHAVAVVAERLTWGFSAARRPVLRGLSAHIPSGARMVVTGANGAGKSTLLSILAGHRLIDPPDAVTVLGRRVFADFRALGPASSLLSQEWRATLKTLGAGGSLPFRELAAAEAARLAGEGFEPGQLRARLAHLVAVLEIDEAWQPGRVSDGQLRRMQLAVKLMAPRPLVLLDEVSVDLDVTARDALLAFLAAESRAGGVTVVYCTHILDGLAGWASHHLHLTRGAAAVCAPMDASMAQHAPAGAANESALGGGSRLYLYVQGLLWGETAASAGGTAAEEEEEEEEDEFVFGDLSFFPRVVKGGAELPEGWRVRQATTAGAYGSAKWNPRDVREQSEVSPALADTAMEWLPTESQPAEPRWVAVARAERAQEEERQQAVAREAAEREAARERAALEAAAAAGERGQRALSAEDEAAMAAMEGPVSAALAALAVSVQGLSAALARRDGSALAEQRAATARLWQGLGPALDRAGALLDGGAGERARSPPARRLAPEEDDATPYSAVLAEQGRADPPAAAGAPAPAEALPWGFGFGGGGRSNQIAPDELVRSGRLVPERGEGKQ